MLRSFAFGLLALLVGCAAQPSAVTPSDSHLVKVDASNAVAVQRAGYKLVTKNGESLYCRTDAVTGSHIETRTTCLTREELDQRLDATKAALRSLPQPIPSAPGLGH